MKFIPKTIVSFVFFAGVISCTGDLSVSEYVSRKNFNLTGGSFLSDAEQITIKEVILDNGTLLGREVIIEGKLLEKGDHQTHFVVGDKTGRLLIVLTDMIGAGPRLLEASESVFRVFGTVERGKLGLPFVKAKAFIGLETKVALKH